MHRAPVNAIAPDLLTEIGAAFTELGSDESVRCIVLTSAIPRYFMAGADLGVLAQGGMTGDAASIEGAWRALTAHFTTVERVPKPVIAAIQGHALGGGCEMALCADVRVMIDDGRSTIGLTETSLGILPGAGGTQRLPRVVGMARARRMIIESTRLTAPPAMAIGLVDEVASPEDFEITVRSLAERYAAMATRAIGLAKLALLDGLDLPLTDGLRIEARAFAEVIATADAAEGIGAFLGKRPPQFTGR
jgi:enoyl-CoA hydratase/carnithine racemase